MLGRQKQFTQTFPPLAVCEAPQYLETLEPAL